MLASIPLSSLDGRWSNSPSHEDWPKLTFVQRSSNDKGELGENEITGELLRLCGYGRGSAPWSVKVNVLVPTWRHPGGSMDIPAEILILKFALSSNRAGPKKMISTIVQLSPCARTDTDRPQLQVLSQMTCFVEQVLWPSICITQSGRMFFLKEGSLFCSRLKSATGDIRPRKVADLREEFEEGATAFDVEPWSETILLGFPGRLSSMKLRVHQGGDVVPSPEA